MIQTNQNNHKMKSFMFDFTSLFKAYLSYYIHDIFECKNSDTFYFVL